jgi:hypothetical protein
VPHQLGPRRRTEKTKYPHTRILAKEERSLPARDPIHKRTDRIPQLCSTLDAQKTLARFLVPFLPIDPPTGTRSPAQVTDFPAVHDLNNLNAHSITPDSPRTTTRATTAQYGMSSAQANPRPGPLACHFISL